MDTQRERNPRKLTRAAEFRAVLAAGVGADGVYSAYRKSGNGFILRAGANTLDGARLGLIVSRKAARRAVDRNRAKRLAREAFRAARASLPAVDVVLQLKNDLRQSNNATVRREIEYLLRNLAQRPPALVPEHKLKSTT